MLTVIIEIQITCRDVSKNHQFSFCPHSPFPSLKSSKFFNAFLIASHLHILKSIRQLLGGCHCQPHKGCSMSPFIQCRINFPTAVVMWSMVVICLESDSNSMNAPFHCKQLLHFPIQYCDVWRRKMRLLSAFLMKLKENFIRYSLLVPRPSLAFRTDLILCYRFNKALETFLCDFSPYSPSPNFVRLCKL